MSGGRVSNRAASASKRFSSTPVKISKKSDVRRVSGLDRDVVVDDGDDTFSQLSPININDDSGESDDEELHSVHNEPTSPSLSRVSLSSVSSAR